jgi:hypothetical protein
MHCVQPKLNAANTSPSAAQSMPAHGIHSPTSLWTPLADRSCEDAETPCLGKPARCIATGDHRSSILPCNLSFRIGVLDTPSFSGSMRMTPMTSRAPDSADLLRAEALSDGASHHTNQQSILAGARSDDVCHGPSDASLYADRSPAPKHGTSVATKQSCDIAMPRSDLLAVPSDGSIVGIVGRGLAPFVPPDPARNGSDADGSHNREPSSEEHVEHAAASNYSGTISGDMQLSHSSGCGPHPGSSDPDTQLSCSAHFSFSAESRPDGNIGEHMHAPEPKVAAPMYAGRRPSAAADQAVAKGNCNRRYTSTFRIPKDELRRAKSLENRQPNVACGQARHSAAAGVIAPLSPRKDIGAGKVPLLPQVPHDSAVHMWLSEDVLHCREMACPSAENQMKMINQTHKPMQPTMRHSAPHNSPKVGNSRCRNGPDVLRGSSPANSGCGRHTRGSSAGSSRKCTTPWQPSTAWRPACCAENCSTIFRVPPPVKAARERSASRSSLQPPDPFQHFGQCLPEALPEARAARLRLEVPRRRSCSGSASKQWHKPARAAVANDLTERSGSRQGACGLLPGRLRRLHASCSEQESRPSSAQSATHSCAQESSCSQKGACGVAPKSVLVFGAQGQGTVVGLQSRCRVETLPSHEERIRKQPRERVPHCHDRLFAGFGDWREVSYFTLQVLTPFL